MTDLSRRSFLATLAATAAGIFAPRDTERVYSFPPTPTIWTPPKRIDVSFKARVMGAATYNGIEVMTVLLPRDPNLVTIETPEQYATYFGHYPPPWMFAPVKLYTIPAVGS